MKLLLYHKFRLISLFIFWLFRDIFILYSSWKLPTSRPTVPLDGHGLNQLQWYQKECIRSVPGQDLKIYWGSLSSPSCLIWPSICFNRMAPVFQAFWVRKNYVKSLINCHNSKLSYGGVIFCQPQQDNTPLDCTPTRASCRVSQM